MSYEEEMVDGWRKLSGQSQPEAPLVIAPDVRAIIADMEALAEHHAHLAYRESELEAHRPLAKLEAIRRIMGGDNPETGKAHSYSSAEKAVETDAEYFAHLKTIRDVVLEKGLTWAKLEAARLRARLGIAVIGGVA